MPSSENSSVVVLGRPARECRCLWSSEASTLTAWDQDQPLREERQAVLDDAPLKSAWLLSL